jgi:hypothetical protein
MRSPWDELNDLRVELGEAALRDKPIEHLRELVAKLLVLCDEIEPPPPTGICQ